MSFESTYDEEKGPKPTPFAEYAKRIQSEFTSLIDSDPLEQKVQKFLEQHPSLIPGASTPGAISGHAPIHNAVISQPPLHGFDARVPDFMWLSKHSVSWYAAMVEIERPGKPLFTKNGVPSAEFNQARHQFVQWRAWFDAPANQQLFLDAYGIPQWHRNSLKMELHLILVYGRRKEIENRPALSKQRGMLVEGKNNEELMSFDRLQPHPYLGDSVTVKALGNGEFKVLHVPETYTLSPSNAENLLTLRGLEDAIDSNLRIAPERKEFLKRRIPYWKEWAQSTARKGFISVSYRE